MDYTLVVLAAGKATRFGRLKQVEPIGPNNHVLLEYSVYDAIKAGFNRVVFIVSDESKMGIELIGKKISSKVSVEYCVQRTDDLPEGYVFNREKPWGTAHALYCARELIKGSFAVINADDYYGASAYEMLISFLKNNQNNNNYLAIGYKIRNTLSKHGTVKRGVARYEKGILLDIIESEIVSDNGKIMAHPLDGSSCFEITDDDLATVNLFAFTPSFLKTIVLGFPLFLDNYKDDLSSEYLIPDVLDKQINEGGITVYINSCDERWLGLTYEADKDDLIITLKNYVKEGKYPTDLWKED